MRKFDNYVILYITNNCSVAINNYIAKRIHFLWIFIMTIHENPVSFIFYLFHSNDRNKYVETLKTFLPSCRMANRIRFIYDSKCPNFLSNTFSSKLLHISR